MEDKAINKSMPKQVKHNREARIFNPSPNWILWFWLRTCWNSTKMTTLFWFIFKDLVCSYSKLYQIDIFQTNTIQAHFSGACIYLILPQRVSSCFVALSLQCSFPHRQEFIYFYIPDSSFVYCTLFTILLFLLSSNYCFWPPILNRCDK